MEFGMFHQFPSLPGRADADSFAEAFEQIDAAEQLGLDVMWLSELHFDPKRSVLSAPLSIASAIAARTRRIKIGIAVQVLPLCHPAAPGRGSRHCHDQISHGRLIFGVGRSGLPRTYEDYGVSYAESRDRFAEVLDHHRAGVVAARGQLRGSLLQLQKYRGHAETVSAAAAARSASPPPAPTTYPWAVGERGLPIFIQRPPRRVFRIRPGDPRVPRGL